MRCRILTSPPDLGVETAWRAFLKTIKLPAHYVTPDFFSEPWSVGDRPFAVIAEEEDVVLGVLTGVRRRCEVLSGMPHRAQIALTPGPCRAAVEECLVNGLIALSNGHGVIRLYATEVLERTVARGFSAEKVDDTIVVDLQRSEPELFKSFAGRKQRDLRHAERSGLEIVETDDPDDLAALMPAVEETFRRHGLPVPSLDEIAALMKLKRNRRLFVAKANGRVIAGTVVRFEPGGLAEYSMNVSLRESRREFRPNDALLWAALRWSRAQGCPVFDMAGNSLFKSGFSRQVHIPLPPVPATRSVQVWPRRNTRGISVSSTVGLRQRSGAESTSSKSAGRTAFDARDVRPIPHG